MNAEPRPASYLFLERLQRAAYFRLGHSPPTFSSDSIIERTSDNRGDWSDPIIRETIQTFWDRTTPILANTRRWERISPHADMDRLLKEYRDSPTIHVNPQHHSTLKKFQTAIEGLPAQFPRLSFANAIEKLKGRITLSTLPTGQVNARVLPVPNTDKYLIVFDPALLDYLSSLSNIIVEAIDVPRALEGAKLYAASGQEEPLASRTETRDIREALFNLLAAVAGAGARVPERTPKEPAFAVADHMQHTGAFFIAAHEYAHILLGHMDSGNRHSGTASWQEEVAADQLGFAILDASLAAARIPPPVRFMGVHFFFLAALLAELAVSAVRDGKTTDLSELISKNIHAPSPTHPAAAVRYVVAHDWLQRKYPPPEFRGAEYFAALLLEIAGRLWGAVSWRLARVRERGVDDSNLFTRDEILGLIHRAGPKQEGGNTDTEQT